MHPKVSHNRKFKFETQNGHKNCFESTNRSTNMESFIPTPEIYQGTSKTYHYYLCETEESLPDLFHDNYFLRRSANEAGDIAQINKNTLQVLCTCKKSVKKYVEKDGKLLLNEVESGLNSRLQFVIEHNKYYF